MAPQADRDRAIVPAVGAVELRAARVLPVTSQLRARPMQEEVRDGEVVAQSGRALLRLAFCRWSSTDIEQQQLCVVRRIEADHPGAGDGDAVAGFERLAVERHRTARNLQPGAATSSHIVGNGRALDSIVA